MSLRSYRGRNGRANSRRSPPPPPYCCPYPCPYCTLPLLTTAGGGRGGGGDLALGDPLGLAARAVAPTPAPDGRGPRGLLEAAAVDGEEEAAVGGRARPREGPAEGRGVSD